MTENKAVGLFYLVLATKSQVLEVVVLLKFFLQYLTNYQANNSVAFFFHLVPDRGSVDLG